MNRGLANREPKYYKLAIEDWKRSLEIDSNYEAELMPLTERAEEKIREEKAGKS